MSFVSIFVVLYVSTSFYCKNILSETENMLIALVTVLFLAIKKWPFKINLAQFFVCTILCMLSLITSMLADDEGKLVIYAVLVMYCAFFFTSIIHFETFIKLFSRIMVVVCVFSSIVFILHAIVPDVFTIFPKMTRGIGGYYFYYNLFLCVASSSDKFFRAHGFFWEPGAFQTFINLAIIFVAFETNKHRNKMLVILFVTLILTFSTTGWIVGLINLAVLILVNYRNSGKSILPLLWLPIIAIGVVIGLAVLPDNIDGITFGTAKLEAFADGPSHGHTTSSSVRYDSIYYAIILFFKSPIIGSGFNGIKDMTQTMYHSMFTCTPLNYFAMYGIIYGSVVGFSIYQMSRYLTTFKNEVLAILIFFSFLVSTISEQYVNYLIIDIFIMYGVQIACDRFIGKKEVNYD